MAEVPVTISGVLFDKHGRTTQLVTLMGMASITGLGVGGGPMPPGPGNGGEPPLGIWGPGDPRPNPPIAFPPGWIGGVPPIQPVPPDVQLPPPGSPPVIVPGTTPSHPIVPPPAILVDYPGIGKVVVPQPLPAAPPAA